METVVDVLYVGLLGSPSGMTGSLSVFYHQWPMARFGSNGHQSIQDFAFNIFENFNF